jgi:hypothetical protein
MTPPGLDHQPEFPIHYSAVPAATDGALLRSRGNELH